VLQASLSTYLILDVAILRPLSVNLGPETSRNAAHTAIQCDEPRGVTINHTTILWKHFGDKSRLGIVLLCPFPVVEAPKCLEMLPVCRECTAYRFEPRSDASIQTTIAFESFWRQILLVVLFGVDLPSLLAQKCCPRCQIAAIAATGRMRMRQTTRQSLSIAFESFWRQILTRRC
jgi:hypothetical protein